MDVTDLWPAVQHLRRNHWDVCRLSVTPQGAVQLRAEKGPLWVTLGGTVGGEEGVDLSVRSNGTAGVTAGSEALDVLMGSTWRQGDQEAPAAAGESA